jgi:hypothetical protein
MMSESAGEEEGACEGIQNPYGKGFSGMQGKAPVGWDGRYVKIDRVG